MGHGDAGSGHDAQAAFADLIDEELPSYEPVAGVSGAVRSAGSDTMLNLMTGWAEAFRGFHPSVRPQVEGKGSSTGPPALLENQAEFAPMSREMEPSELDLFVDHFGYEPTELRVAVDCVAVFVHRDNPVASLTIDDVAKAFSIDGDEMTWGDVGVTDAAWRDRPLSLYGRNSASGTYKFFKDQGLGGSDFKPTVKEQPGSSGVVRAIGTDVNGIGYSGIGYATPGVRAVPLTMDAGGDAAPPTFDAAMAGEYPLARFLYLYLNHDAREELGALREGFVRFIYSREGQEKVVQDGAYPVSAEVAREELGKLGLEPGF